MNDLTSKNFTPIIKHGINTNGISAEHRALLLDIRKNFLNIKTINRLVRPFSL